MDKSGLIFVALLGALIALVLSVALFKVEQPGTPPDDGSLIPPAIGEPTP